MGLALSFFFSYGRGGIEREAHATPNYPREGGRENGGEIDYNNAELRFAQKGSFSRQWTTSMNMFRR